MLALANLLWAGNWVTGRALGEVFDPVSLNFWRWTLASLILLPFALPALVAKRAILRRDAGILLVLAFFGVALFQTMVYQGLRTTTAVNAVLLNSSLPLFMLLCSWALEGERPSGRQIAGMLVSLAGILVIVSRGELERLRQVELHAGDAWILLAMPVWGIYSVLLKRRPSELGGSPFLLAISAAGALMLAPLYAAQAIAVPPRWPSPAEAIGVLYIALAASVLAFAFWNRGVAVVGANAAGFTIHLLPAFGTVLAILLLDESFAGFHAAGFVIILCGVFLATRR
ncbi:MAG TPA: DMT family transporter [Burkholderiales bacterium]